MATVLFVDDEAAIRRAVRAWLTRLGHVVHEAGSLAEAKRIVLDHRVDGVFIDLWIGNESGIELLGWIDDLDPALGRSVAFLTGDLFATRLVPRQFGHPIIMKPFRFADLEEQVARWVRRRNDPGEHGDRDPGERRPAPPDEHPRPPA